MCKYSGSSPYGHLTHKKTSQLQSSCLSPKLYSTVQITPCNKVTSPLRSLCPLTWATLIERVHCIIACRYDPILCYCDIVVVIITPLSPSLTLSILPLYLSIYLSLALSLSLSISFSLSISLFLSLSLYLSLSISLSLCLSLTLSLRSLSLSLSRFLSLSLSLFSLCISISTPLSLSLSLSLSRELTSAAESSNHMYCSCAHCSKHDIEMFINTCK